MLSPTIVLPHTPLLLCVSVLVSTCAVSRIHDDRRKKHTMGSSMSKEFQEGWKRHGDMKRMEKKLDHRMIS